MQAWHDCRARLQQFQAEGLYDDALLVARIAEENGRIVRAHLGRATKGKAPDKAAADVVLKAHAQARQLFGLDKRPDATYTLDQVVGLLRRYTQAVMEVVPDPAVRLEIARRFQREAGPALRGDVVVDVPAAGAPAEVARDERAE